MAGRSIDYTAHLEADDEITPAAEDAARALDKLESQGDVEVKFRGDTAKVTQDIDDVLSKVDKLAGTDAANLVLTSNAAQIGNEIADLVVQINDADAADITIDAKVENIAQLESGLERLSTKAKEINGQEINLKSAGGRKAFDDIVDGAGQAQSATANMVGNVGQDMGELAGITGSAGVAIGQLAEYFTDTAFKAKEAGQGMGAAFKTFATAAVPIAAIGVAISAVTSLMGEQKAAAEASAQRITDMGDAMDGASDKATGLSKYLQDNTDALTKFDAKANSFGKEYLENLGKFGKAFPIIGGLIGDAGQNITDLTSIIDDAGLSMYDFASAIEPGSQSTDEFEASLQAAADAGQITGDQMKNLMQAVEQYGNEAQKAADKSDLMLVKQKDINAMFSEGVDPLDQYQGAWAILKAEMADGVDNTGNAAEAMNLLREKLGLTNDEITSMTMDQLAEDEQAAAKAAEEAAAAQARMASAVSEANVALIQGVDASGAFAEALSRVNEASQLDFSTMALQTVDSFDTMKESLTGLKDVAVDWSTVDLSPDSVEELKGIPDELAAVTDGVMGMRDTIQTELQAAFDTGGIEAYTAKADFFAGQIRDQMPAAFQAAGASAGDAARLTEDLLGELQLLPESKEIMIKLTREEEARNALAAFSSVIAEMPDSVQIAVNTKIAQGDIEGALAILNEQLINRGYAPIVLPVDADIAAAQAKIDPLTGQPLPPATLPVEGDATGAEGAIAGAKETADSTEGVINVGASIGDVLITMATIGAIVAKMAPPPIQITANATPAVATAAAAGAVISALKPVFNVGANPGPAMSLSAAAAQLIQSLRPVMTVLANPAPALAVGAIAAAAIQSQHPRMTIEANPGPALAVGAIAAAAIQSQHPVIPVSAQLHDYPSAADIAGRIGTVRVPIDAYVRTVPRIDGSRLGG